MLLNKILINARQVNSKTSTKMINRAIYDS